MLIIIIVLIVVIIALLIKAFNYYCTARGLLYYLGTKHKDMLEPEKAMELRDMAIDRTIKEFFHRC